MKVFEPSRADCKLLPIPGRKLEDGDSKPEGGYPAVDVEVRCVYFGSVRVECPPLRASRIETEEVDVVRPWTGDENSPSHRCSCLVIESRLTRVSDGAMRVRIEKLPN